MQFIIHYFLHLIFPAVIAYFFYQPRWQKVYVMLLLTMLVDLDHLLADPIYMACRCSIGFHPLHGYLATGAYIGMLIPRATRIVAIGLLMHMATDGIDCLFSRMNCG
jgi:hypothetical protein